MARRTSKHASSDAMPPPLSRPQSRPSARPGTRVERGEPGRGAVPPPVAIVVSRYNESITGVLLEGAIAEYERHGGTASELAIYDAPGTYELPVLARAAVVTGRFSGAVALGCIIRGQTRHDRYIAEAVAHGIMDIAVRTGTPVAFGVLTVENPAQARDRAGGKKGNKGAEAMAALLETLGTLDLIAAGGRGVEGGSRAAENGFGRPDKAASGAARARLGGGGPGRERGAAWVSGGRR